MSKQIYNGKSGDRVKGTYHSAEFTGTINRIRFHTCHHQKMVVFVNLDAPIDVLGLERDAICLEPFFDGLERDSYCSIEIV